uniref:Reverse transcriptase domain-containing protein n=1 Tax=Megaselia scalaris TaxID=36166 RepID=T1GPE4_MEGSC
MGKLKKRRFEKQHFEELEFMRDRNQPRKFYENVNKPRRNYTPVGSACNDRNGDPITNKKEVLIRWEEFFSELLNGNKQHSEEQTPFVFQNNKSAGSDGIPAELLKAAGAIFNHVFHRLLSNVWISEKMPEEWNVSICPVHKKTFHLHNWGFYLFVLH